MDLSFGLGVNSSKLGGLIWGNGREGIYWQLGNSQERMRKSSWWFKREIECNSDLN